MPRIRIGALSFRAAQRANSHDMRVNLWILSLLCGCVALAATARSMEGPRNVGQPRCQCGSVETECPPQFLEALRRAKAWDLEPARLRGIRRSDATLQWTEDGRLPVVTLVGNQSELPAAWRSAGQRGFVSLRASAEYWVTLKDEFVKRVSTLARSNAPEGLPHRVRQLLGLRPCDTALDTLVEFSVKVDPEMSPLVRPCYDDEISDDRCEKAKRNTPLAPRIEQWATWDYPFTRLGYTYDWGGGVVGLSEYVIVQTTELVLRDVVSLDVVDAYVREQRAR
jgi:hypothetical protein